VQRDRYTSLGIYDHYYTYRQAWMMYRKMITSRVDKLTIYT